MVDRPDSWVTTSIQARLYSDDAVRGRDIDVRTQNGVVTLAGTVESDQAKQQAITIARDVDGVVRVEDQLMVQVPAQAQDQPAGADRDANTVATTGAADDTTSPGWITTKIQAQYFVNPGIKPWNIDVTTSSGGIVELRGEVDSADDKAEAVRVARATDGVTRVNDHLRVKTEAAADRTGEAPNVTGDIDNSDPWVTLKVQSKYFLDTDVKGRDIDVTTQNGVVTLRGTVESAAERRQAVAIARNTDGVREVRDELQLLAEADAPAATTGTASRAATAIEDTWITTKIQARYFLDPDLKGHEIDVDTSGGAVTIAGTVESADGKQEAEQIARETDGVARVVNRLTVAPAQAQ